MEEPLAARPLARAFRVEKYCGNMATDGTNIQPFPSPMQIACASMVCQYLWERLVIINPRGMRTAPVVMRYRK